MNNDRSWRDRSGRRSRSAAPAPKPGTGRSRGFTYPLTGPPGGRRRPRLSRDHPVGLTTPTRRHPARCPGTGRPTRHRPSPTAGRIQVLNCRRQTCVCGNGARYCSCTCPLPHAGSFCRTPSLNELSDGGSYTRPVIEGWSVVSKQAAMGAAGTTPRSCMVMVSPSRTGPTLGSSSLTPATGPTATLSTTRTPLYSGSLSPVR